MLHEAYVHALIGGVLIGLAATLMLWWNGRVTGISGIISGALTYVRGDWGWRLAFILGLLLAGLALATYSPERFINSSGRNLVEVAIAGLLVGYGTVMGGGCTSGHGVCGVSRLSPRSLLATVTFILGGVAIVTALRLLGVA